MFYRLVQIPSILEKKKEEHYERFMETEKAGEYSSFIFS